jgi:hypothetical protein
MCIMFVTCYLVGRKIKHYLLTMNPIRCFEIQSAMVFFLSLLRERCCKKIRCKVRLNILFVTNLGWLAICEDYCNPNIGFTTKCEVQGPMRPRVCWGANGNLTPDHKSFKSKGQMRFNWNVLYTIGKIFLRAIRYCLCTFKINLI